jgi:hypothetical protein
MSGLQISHDILSAIVNVFIVFKRLPPGKGRGEKAL